MSIKDCPFCGGKADKYMCQETDNWWVRWVIGCTKCKSSTRVFFGECEGLEEAWNTRTALKPMTREEAEKLVGNLINLVREETYADEQGYFSKVSRIEQQIEKSKAKLIQLIAEVRS